jgi:hypothetical protein
MDYGLPNVLDIIANAEVNLLGPDSGHKNIYAPLPAHSKYDIAIILTTDAAIKPHVAVIEIKVTASERVKLAEAADDGFREWSMIIARHKTALRPADSLKNGKSDSLTGAENISNDMHGHKASSIQRIPLT